MDQSWSPRNSTQAANGQLQYGQSPRFQQPPNMTSSRGDFEGDMSMDDATDLDPYNKQKYEDVARAPEYPTRQSTHRSRPSSQYIPQPPQEESSAARRYSPMKLSATPTNGATSPYTSYTASAQPQSSRTSPTRPSLYTSHSNSYYSSPRT